MAVIVKLFLPLLVCLLFTTAGHTQNSPSITFYRTQIHVRPDNILQTAPINDFMASKPKAGRTEIVYLAKKPTQLAALDSQSSAATENTTSRHPDVKRNKDFDRVPLNIVQEIDISDNEKVYLDYNGMVYLAFINHGETKDDKVQMATALTYEKEAFDYIFLSDDMQLFGVKPNLEVMQLDRTFLLKGYEKFKYYFPNLTKAHKYVAGASTLIGLLSFLFYKDSEILAQATAPLSIGSAAFFYIATNLSLFLRDFSMTSEISSSLKRPYMFFNKTTLTLKSKITSLKISDRDARKSTFNGISYELTMKNGDRLDLANLLEPYGHFNEVFTNLINNKQAKNFAYTPSTCLQSLK